MKRYIEKELDEKMYIYRDYIYIYIYIYIYREREREMRQKDGQRDRYIES